MIPGDGWQAEFTETYTTPDGREADRFRYDDVVFFTEDGDGMINGSNRSLVAANRLKGFNGYERRPRVVAMLPAKGWEVQVNCGRWGQPVGSGFLDPVIAWLAYDDGTVSGVGVIDGLPEVITGAEYRPPGGWPTEDNSIAAAPDPKKPC